MQWEGHVTSADAFHNKSPNESGEVAGRLKLKGILQSYSRAHCKSWHHEPQEKEEGPSQLTAMGDPRA